MLYRSTRLHGLVSMPVVIVFVQSFGDWCSSRTRIGNDACHPVYDIQVLIRGVTSMQIGVVSSPQKRTGSASAIVKLPNFGRIRPSSGTAICTDGSATPIGKRLVVGF